MEEGKEFSFDDDLNELNDLEEAEEFLFDDLKEEILFDNSLNEKTEYEYTKPEEYQAAYSDINRIGIGREGEEDLSTYDEKSLEGGKKILTNEQKYSYFINKIKEKGEYKITDDDIKDCLRLIPLLKTQRKNFQFKSSVGILFALKCLSNKKIDMDKFYKTISFAEKENMTEADLLRYCFLVEGLYKNKN
jgi:hypothetical protein